MTAAMSANSETFEVSTPSPREIRMTRLFQAPRRLVFEAMTRPEHVRQWWGCLGEGYSVPACEIDLRPGGTWRVVHRHPKGEHMFYGVYREIAAPERLVYTETFDQFPDTELVVTAAFAEEGRGTRLTVTVICPSEPVRDGVIQSGMARGAATGYDRLEDLVARLAPGP
ncbi:MAG: SRPBCC family protein [Acidobacteria bacterium]|nr:SRPBCC family protein [Acidobacteriota bacterium]